MDALLRLRSLIARHAGDGLTPTAVPHLSLFAATSPSKPVGDMVEPALALVVQGAKRTVLADREFRYGAGDFLVASVGLPVTGAITRATPSEPFLVLVLHLNPATIAGLVLQTAPEPAAPVSDCGLAVSRAGPAMLDAATRLLELLDHPRDAAALAPLYERELLWRLLTGEQGAMVRQIGLAGSHLNHLGHAIGWLRAHYREPMRIGELAALSAMSPRTFHRHFRAVTRMTPLDYQKRLRLNEARARLTADPHDVAGVAYAVGYDNPSQFSREYRRMFGAPPSRDATRTRKPSLAQGGRRFS
jgi:AraC-like DNA-binding protein